MTDYLVRTNTWHIARPCAVEDYTVECTKCVAGVDEKVGGSCRECGGMTRCKVDEATIRLAWAERDGSILCFDYQEPEVKRLPD